jgi:hypothetical protein
MLFEPVVKEFKVFSPIPILLSKVKPFAPFHIVIPFTFNARDEVAGLKVNNVCPSIVEAVPVANNKLFFTLLFIVKDDEPDDPEDPAVPEDPEVPLVKPDVPDVPDEPLEPDDPDIPDVPELPLTPLEPELPDDPFIPDVPEEPF